MQLEVRLMRMPGKSPVCVTLTDANSECAHKQ